MFRARLSRVEMGPSLLGRRLRCVSFALFALGIALVTPRATFAHPGQHMSLSISIGDKEIRYEILLSSDFHGLLIPQDRYELKLRRNEDNTAFKFLEPEQEKEQRALLEAFFKDKNPVTIDGIRVQPILRDMAFMPVEKDWEFPTPMLLPDVRLTLDHPTKGQPKLVSMVWEIFPQDPKAKMYGVEPWIDIVAELDAYDENKIVIFTKGEPEIIWHAPGKPVTQRVMPVIAKAERIEWAVPLFSVGLIVVWFAILLSLRFSKRWPRIRKAALGFSVVPIIAAVLCHGVFVTRIPSPWAPVVKLPSESDSIGVFESLHRNVYRAFEYKNESDIYDALAQSVDGEMLDQVYNEVYQSLIMREHGGAIARIQSVDVLDANIESSGVMPDSGNVAFKVRALWQVHGAVYHWGHIHARTNEYKAIYTVAQRGEKWKITGAEVLGQHRIVSDDEEDPASGNKSTPKERPTAIVPPG